MSSPNVYAVIMAGGTGTRLWPYSRQRHPKQFLDLLGLGYSLLQGTYMHIRRQIDKDRVFVVTHEEHADLVRHQLPELSDDHVLSEPMRRNTAPCIAYISYRMQKQDPTAVTVVMPADHYVTDKEGFDTALDTALSSALEDDRIVTLGIRPTRPDTAYGYIQFLDSSEGELKKVKTFTEKPEASLAKKFVKSGDFLWNTGIFVWKIETIMRALEQYAPEIAEIFREGHSSYHTSSEGSFLQHAYSIAPTISIDYAIMEKYKSVYVVPCNFEWSDLGSLGSTLRHTPQGRAPKRRNRRSSDKLPKQRQPNTHQRKESSTH